MVFDNYIQKTILVDFMSNDEAIIFAAFIIFLLIVGGVVLIDLYLYNSNLNELQEYLKDINYFKIYHQHFLALFGTDKLYREKKVSLQIANNFGTSESKRMNYMVKYFGLKINDETLSHINTIYHLQIKVEKFVSDSSTKQKILNDQVTPYFMMTYTSPQGRSSKTSLFEFNSKKIKKLKTYVEKIISQKKTVASQRQAMTPQLREFILRRDNWTCQKCGNSQFKEPNLLLEVDHIIPISRGGKTEPSNLQTLCWKCNRSKSDKIEIPKESKNYQNPVFPSDPDELKLN